MKKILGAMLVLASLTGCSQYSLVNSDVYNNADLTEIHTFRIVTPEDGSLPPGMQEVTYYNIAAAIREQLVERGFTESAASPILVNIGLTVKTGTDYTTYSTPGTLVSANPVPVGAPPVNPAPNPTVSVPAPQPEGGPGPAILPDGPVHRINPNPTPRPAPGPVFNGMAPYFMYPRAYYYPGTTQIVESTYREGVLTMDIVDLKTKTPLYSSSVATILDNGDTQFRNLEGIAKAVKVLFSKFPVPLLPQYK